MNEQPALHIHLQLTAYLIYNESTYLKTNDNDIPCT